MAKNVPLSSGFEGAQASAINDIISNPGDNTWSPVNPGKRLMKKP